MKVWHFDVNGDFEQENFEIGSKKILKLKTKGYVKDLKDWKGKLYKQLKNREMNTKEINMTLVPYFSWENREKGPMNVWLRK
jgi:DUF1680 family protein